MKRMGVCGAAVLMLLAGAVEAAEAPYPARPIRVLVGYGAGGGADVATRLIAPRMSERFGQPVVVDNRPGAGSRIATEMLARSAPDGYTIMMANVSFGATPALHLKLDYHAARDFSPVVMVDIVPNVLLVHPSVPVKSAGDLIALAKSQPGKLRHAFSGIGSAGHLIAESLQHDADITFLNIPYQSGPQSAAAVLGGEAQIVFVSVPTTLANMKTGKVRAVAVTSVKRNAALPEVPTIAETAIPGFSVNEWHGIIAPAGTPKAIIAALNTEVNRALTVQEVKERLSNLGAEVAGGTPEQITEHARIEIARWKKILKPVD